MPQRKKNRAIRAPFSQPQIAVGQGFLLGLGQFTLQLDGNRLKVPSPVRRRLGANSDHPFIISPWHGPRLRIIPESLWAAYLESICARIHDHTAAEDLVSRLSQTSAVKSLDGRDRWDLPTTLANGAGLITEKKSVVLLPFQFGLEVMSADAWAAFVQQTIQITKQADVCSTDFQI